MALPRLHRDGSHCGWRRRWNDLIDAADDLADPRRDVDWIDSVVPVVGGQQYLAVLVDHWHIFGRARPRGSGLRYGVERERFWTTSGRPYFVCPLVVPAARRVVFHRHDVYRGGTRSRLRNAADDIARSWDDLVRLESGVPVDRSEQCVGLLDRHRQLTRRPRTVRSG